MARIPQTRLDVDAIAQTIRGCADEDAAVAALRAAGYDAERSHECGCFYDGFCGENIIVIVERLGQTKAGAAKRPRQRELRFLGMNGRHVATGELRR